MWLLLFDRHANVNCFHFRYDMCVMLYRHVNSYSEEGWRHEINSSHCCMSESLLLIRFPSRCAKHDNSEKKKEKRGENLRRHRNCIIVNKVILFLFSRRVDMQPCLRRCVIHNNFFAIVNLQLLYLMPWCVDRFLITGFYLIQSIELIHFQRL